MYSDEISRWADVYFNRSKKTVEIFGDVKVTYALFMRRPVVSAPKLAMDWLTAMAAERGTSIKIQLTHEEGRWVGAGEPLMYVTGQLSQLVDLETLLLQKIGPPCVAAWNAFTMCSDLQKVGFLAMEARHCAGREMAEMMAYAAAVGSERARRKSGAVGFVGKATAATAHYFGREAGLGTMPQAYIGLSLIHI